MSQPAEVLKDAVARFLSGDQAAIAAIMEPDIVVHIPGRGKLAGEYKGHDGFFGFFGKAMEMSGGTFQLEPHDLAGSADHAVGIYNVSAERNGRKFTWRQVNVYHVRNDRIAEVWVNVPDLYDYDEFWS